ncbi:glycosyltransferase family 4 protein [Marinomonas sp. BSi20584]|uniref:glycosyltransferase family 4 protein n=1 Tax=Marinomonas sp. BSi20584 TaxID=1594462 RepID=UPI000CC9A971|nr:glycosyltransferase family 1 protein [Marinomonas sp. BSi20584]PJE53277.1 hypothetical protein TY87_21665 [Marinomonas sp. BSi20584]
MKIGIESKGFDGWGGGVDFIRHVASCLELADENNELKKHILLAQNDCFFHLKKQIIPFRKLLAQLAHREPLRWMPWKGFDEHYLRKTFSDFHSYQLDAPGNRLSSHFAYAKKQNIDVLIPCISPPPENYLLPWVGYIYDFQHKYLPEFFTERDIKERDNAFRQMLNRAEHVIVNAQSVKKDADKFIGNYNAKIHVLPFSPNPREEWLDENRDLSRQYGITKPYFIICNQFWIHKDHSTAFRAFSDFLKKVGKKYQLVCTGDTSDSRFPDYYNSLLDLIRELNIEDDIKIVGHIPKLDQISLLKQSSAVIQPTLFEGGPGGGAAYDAIALGKPLIVSDIPVNLEIEKDDRVFFFRSKDVGDLVLKMQEASQFVFNAVDNDVLRDKGKRRKLACGRVLLGVINEAAAK